MVLHQYPLFYVLDKHHTLIFQFIYFSNLQAIVVVLRQQSSQRTWSI